MDPITHGLLGAVTAGSLAREREWVRIALLAGAAGGMLPDVDVFIRSDTDPLLAIEYHRHFTHSLIFIPVLGAVAAVLLWLIFLLKKPFLPIWGFATASCAVHGLLDACTSYGTQLLWPFANDRVAWNIISIIDPIFTLPLLILVIMTAAGRGVRWPRIAAIFAAVYLAFGIWQHQRAFRFQSEIAAERGHAESLRKATVKPTIGNLVLWRSIYLQEGEFHIDGLRVGYFGNRRHFEGPSVPAWPPEGLLDSVPEDSALAHDLARFAHFSDGYLAPRPEEPNVIGDLRYSFLPFSPDPLWGIRIDWDQPDQHVEFVEFHQIDAEAREQFFDMVFGR